MKVLKPSEYLMKAKALPAGTMRKYGNEWHRKEGNKWVYIGKDGSPKAEAALEAAKAAGLKIIGAGGEPEQKQQQKEAPKEGAKKEASGEKMKEVKVGEEPKSHDIASPARLEQWFKQNPIEFKNHLIDHLMKVAPHPFLKTRQDYEYRMPNSAEKLKIMAKKYHLRDTQTPIPKNWNSLYTEEKLKANRSAAVYELAILERKAAGYLRPPFNEVENTYKWMMGKDDIDLLEKEINYKRVVDNRAR